MAAENKLLHKARETVKYDSSSSVENGDQDDPNKPAEAANIVTDNDQTEGEDLDDEGCASISSMYATRPASVFLIVM